MTHPCEDTGEFYDRVVQRQAEYPPDTLERFRPRLDGFDAEARFTQLVQQHVGPDDVVVDVGTGDGHWLMTTVAPRAGKAIFLVYPRSSSPRPVHRVLPKLNLC